MDKIGFFLPHSLLKKISAGQFADVLILILSKASDRKYPAFDLIAMYENRSFKTSLSRSQGMDRRHRALSLKEEFYQGDLAERTLFSSYVYGSRGFSLWKWSELFLLSYPI